MVTVKTSIADELLQVRESLSQGLMVCKKGEPPTVEVHVKLVTPKTIARAFL